MRKVTTGSSMLALAAALAVGACSSGSNRDSTAGTSGGDVGPATRAPAATRHGSRARRDVRRLDERQRDRQRRRR